MVIYMKKRIIHLENINSTNSYLKELAVGGAEEGTAVIADRQTAGKGRMGRNFYSPDSGLYMSLLLRPKKNISDALVITAAAAVATVRAIESVCKKKCFIKWVNDIYTDGKKVCGILAEGSVLPNGKTDFVVIGIGINIIEPKDGFPSDIKNIATSLFEKNTDFYTVREKLFGAIYNEFFSICENLSDRSFMDFYRERSLLLNKDIFYLENGIKTAATVTDIDNCGYLILKTENGTKKLNSGEVSVRIKEDE